LDETTKIEPQVMRPASVMSEAGLVTWRENLESEMNPKLHSPPEVNNAANLACV
jgi:hypothetical protein